jgi:hypothetical protein
MQRRIAQRSGIADDKKGEGDKHLDRVVDGLQRRELGLERSVRGAKVRLALAQPLPQLRRLRGGTLQLRLELRGSLFVARRVRRRVLKLEAQLDALVLHGTPEQCLLLVIVIVPLTATFVTQNS